MTADVNPVGEGATLRQAQTALTEQRIATAATELFLADGYVATTLEAVARRARVAARTVYVRFGTKAGAVQAGGRRGHRGRHRTGRRAGAGTG